MEKWKLVVKSIFRAEILFEQIYEDEPEIYYKDNGVIEFNGDIDEGRISMDCRFCIYQINRIK